MKSTIAWLVPPPIKGSGGIREIYNKVQYLCDQGHECHVFVEGSINPYELVDQVEQYYGARDCVLHSGWNYSPDAFDLIFATVWNSAREVAKAPARVKKAYLVQDYEAWFHPQGEGFHWADESYRLGLQPICLGRWLPNVLQRLSGLPSRSFDFCYERPLYFPTVPWEKREPAVCYIHQPDKPRRCAVIGLDALEILKRDVPELTIYLYGSAEQAKVNFPHVNLGILPPHDINALYNRCRLGLCISASNPSRIPFEMMAAGLPVVDVYRENNLYDFPDEGVLLAEANSVALARALKEMVGNPDRLQRMSEFGLTWMKTRPMEKEYEQFYLAVQSVLNGEEARTELPARCYRREAVTAHLS